ncbi:SDR family NAD(P)-dependent oxidoreductase [Nakamurella sp. YIM 132087]|uniref:SDR family NAD(P)-dependent oxidoreductase n=1 Tax=Nakamurella alba TaxID=2665158 RepID=A0A7K1FR74_9ACTN|nr:SDR family oxidoreductase [Nakamurella alba]MTD16651.1 SDR family NAD(P)-dependent oxidoreductase [Nakamurella alba]
MPVETRDLTGTVVLVTGAGAGIGAAITTLLLEAGARVVLVDRDPAAAAAVAATWPADQVLVQQADVRVAADLDRAVDAAVARWGRFDSAVCNAGIGAFGGILDVADEMLDAIVDVNLMGTVRTVRAAVRHFDTRPGGGDLVIVASVAGLGSAGGNESVYAAAKHGQVGLAISLDRELRHRGIRVSTIAPAAVNTGFADGLGRVAGDPVKDTFLLPSDVAGAVVTVLAQPRRVRTALWTLWSMDETPAS